MEAEERIEEKATRKFGAGLHHCFHSAQFVSARIFNAANVSVSLLDSRGGWSVI